MSVWSESWIFDHFRSRNRRRHRQKLRQNFEPEHWFLHLAPRAPWGSLGRSAHGIVAIANHNAENMERKTVKNEHVTHQNIEKLLKT